MNNKIEVIGIDHGWSNMKTSSQVFTTGVKEITSILSNAASVMLIHSHPSGNLLPSKQDTMITDRMNAVCEMVGIQLIDHVIVGGNNREFFSFKEKGLMDNPKITYATDYRNFSFTNSLVAEQGKGR